MTDEELIKAARVSKIELYGLGKNREKWLERLRSFQSIAAKHEREEIAQIFDIDSHLVAPARNDEGGCLICGFTPRVAAQVIRAGGKA